MQATIPVNEIYFSGKQKMEDVLAVVTEHRYKGHYRTGVYKVCKDIIGEDFSDEDAASIIKNCSKILRRRYEFLKDALRSYRSLLKNFSVDDKLMEQWEKLQIKKHNIKKLNITPLTEDEFIAI